MVNSRIAGWTERSNTQRQVLVWVKTALKRITPLILSTGILGCSESAYLPYICDDARHKNSDEEITGCMNHKFPTKKEVFEYFNNSTFMRATSKNNYSIIYYNPNGQYTQVDFSDDSAPWGSVSTDGGPWRVDWSILPMRSKNQSRDATVADLCSSSIIWSIYMDDNGNEALDSRCSIVWNLKTLTDDSSDRLNGWKKIGPGDIYGIDKIYGFAPASNRFLPDFNVKDYIKNASPDIPPSIEEIVRMIYVKQSEYELDIKQRDSEHRNSPSSTQ